MQSIIRYMKAVMIAIMFASLNLFFYFANHWVKGVCVGCGIAALIYAYKLGRNEDKRKIKLIEQQTFPDIQLITTDTEISPQKYSWHQRIVLWLYKKNKLP